jgi:hypothetical protein
MIAMMASVLRMLATSGWIAAGIGLSCVLYLLLIKAVFLYGSGHTDKWHGGLRPLPWPQGDRARRLLILIYLIAAIPTGMAVALVLSGVLPGTL